MLKKLAKFSLLSALCLNIIGCDYGNKAETVSVREYQKAEEQYLKKLKVIDYGNFLQGKPTSKENHLMISHINILQKYAILKTISDTPENKRRQLENLPIGDLIKIFEEKNNYKINEKYIKSGYNVPLFMYMESEEIRKFTNDTIPNDKLEIIMQWVNKNKHEPVLFNEMKTMTMEELYVSHYLYTMSKMTNEEKKLLEENN